MAEEDFFSLLLTNHIGGGAGMPPDEQQQQQLLQRQRRIHLQHRVTQQNQQDRRDSSRSSYLDGRDAKGCLERQCHPAYHASTAAPGAVGNTALDGGTATSESWQLLQQEQQHLQRQWQQTEIGCFVEHQRQDHPHQYRQQHLRRHRQRPLSRGVIPRCAGDSQPSSRASSRSSSPRMPKYSTQGTVYCSSRLRGGSRSIAARRRNSSRSTGNSNNRSRVRGRLKRNSREPQRNISTGVDSRRRGQKPSASSLSADATSSSRCSSRSSTWRHRSSNCATSRSYAKARYQQHQQQQQGAEEQHKKQAQHQKQQQALQSSRVQKSNIRSKLSTKNSSRRCKSRSLIAAVEEAAMTRLPLSFLAVAVFCWGKDRAAENNACSGGNRNSCYKGSSCSRMVACCSLRT
ncbi:LOW QUALITY PROTEIN: uncharacterized protein EMH_0066040 [Eimeria mitis]|uniref:Uncharacterized protein n=1 Tax=Eimeria mitis TaxID=44415 RepID=U6KIP9_9EIME|nr:LOW QUALITY PROTEIN: uncharacterized protein EMH_0066040 [Eimeria mitis]CDJ36147.1 hypothetical protein EMH_0066040 [Eimeria mitis]